MTLVEELRRVVERVTGRGRPSRRDFRLLLRKVKPTALVFTDDGRTPNSPLPLLHYRQAVRAHEDFDAAAVLEEVFAAHGWKDSWRNGIYRHLHFHTGTHEVLGIARGQARVQFGGSKGKVVPLIAGDVVVLPAGTGHKRLSGSRDLLVVGAYPPRGEYDEPGPDKVSHEEALERIAKVPLPRQDPLYGGEGPLPKRWSRRRRRGAPRPTSAPRGARKK